MDNTLVLVSTRRVISLCLRGGLVSRVTIYTAARSVGMSKGSLPRGMAVRTVRASIGRTSIGRTTTIPTRVLIRRPVMRRVTIRRPIMRRVITRGPNMGESAAVGNTDRPVVAGPSSVRGMGGRARRRRRPVRIKGVGAKCLVGTRNIVCKLSKDGRIVRSKMLLFPRRKYSRVTKKTLSSLNSTMRRVRVPIGVAGVRSKTFTKLDGLK